MNPNDSIMISTLLFFENLQNIHLFLRPGKINGYVEAPGKTPLLKMSKIVVGPIGYDPKLLIHSLFAPPHLPALSSAQRWWNETNTMKTIWRGAIEASSSPDSRYLESCSAAWSDREIWQC